MIPTIQTARRSESLWAREAHSMDMTPGTPSVMPAGVKVAPVTTEPYPTITRLIYAAYRLPGAVRAYIASRSARDERLEDGIVIAALIVGLIYCMCAPVAHKAPVRSYQYFDDGVVSVSAGVR